MHFARLLKLTSNISVAAASFLMASGLAGCGGGSTAAYAPLANTTAASHADADAAMATWSRGLMKLRLPGSGCFSASYPALAWSRIPCATPAASMPVPRSHALHASTIGNGNDYTLVSLPYVMSAAYGSFPVVTGVTSVRSKGIKAFGGKGTSSPNVYSLQLNSNNFSTSACAGLAHCVGWTQFVYTNQPRAYSQGGNLIIQDWLLSSNSQDLTGCPHNAGWEKADGACVQNASIMVAVPGVPISQLRSLSLSGSADSSGDSAFLAVGSTVYGMKNMQSDGITGLSDHWTGAEFNVVGNGGGSRAMFNAGSTITVNLEADTGSTTSPLCRGDSGTTGESNNLSFVTAPVDPTIHHYPSIQFTESNAGGGSPSCDAVAAH